ncbi:MAG: AbrB/MazE/SpoVT family DNA-binding domain-containing protein [Gemmatimonadaceae bacterium]
MTLDKAGRVVNPKTLRDELHLEAGDALELTSDGDRMTLRPVRTGSALRKEHGAWVCRRNGSTMSTETTTQVPQSVRNDRDRVKRSPQTSLFLVQELKDFHVGIV